MTRMRTWIALAAFSLSGCVPSAARDERNAQGSTSEPAVAFAGRVTDQANLLSPGQETVLTSTLTNLEASTQHQLVVVTVTSLEGRDIKSFTTELANAWGIGRKTHNDGVVLLVAPNERQMRIAVGYGLEKKLTDEICTQIVEHRILPHFKSGDMPAGIVAGVDAVVAELT